MTGEIIGDSVVNGESDQQHVLAQHQSNSYNHSEASMPGSTQGKSTESPQEEHGDRRLNLSDTDGMSLKKQYNHNFSSNVPIGKENSENGNLDNEGNATQHMHYMDSVNNNNNNNQLLFTKQVNDNKKGSDWNLPFDEEQHYRSHERRQNNTENRKENFGKSQPLANSDIVEHKKQIAEHEQHRESSTRENCDATTKHPSEMSQSENDSPPSKQEKGTATNENERVAHQVNPREPQKSNPRKESKTQHKPTSVSERLYEDALRKQEASRRCFSTNNNDVSETSSPSIASSSSNRSKSRGRIRHHNDRNDNNSNYQNDSIDSTRGRHLTIKSSVGHQKYTRQRSFKRKGHRVASSWSETDAKSESNQNDTKTVSVTDRLYEDAKRKNEARRQKEAELIKQESKYGHQQLHELVEQPSTDHKQHDKSVPTVNRSYKDSNPKDESQKAGETSQEVGDKVTLEICKNNVQKLGETDQELEKQTRTSEKPPNQKRKENISVVDRLYEDAKRKNAIRKADKHFHRIDNSPDLKQKDRAPVPERLHQDVNCKIKDLKTDTDAESPTTKCTALEEFPGQKKKDNIPVLERLYEDAKRKVEAHRADDNVRMAVAPKKIPNKSSDQKQKDKISTPDFSRGDHGQKSEICEDEEGSEGSGCNINYKPDDSSDQKQKDNIPVLDRLYEDAKRKVEARRADKTVHKTAMQKRVTEKSPEQKQKGKIPTPEDSRESHEQKSMTSDNEEKLGRSGNKKELDDPPYQKQKDSIPVLDRLYEDAKRKVEARRADKTGNQKKVIDKSPGEKQKDNISVSDRLRYDAKRKNNSRQAEERGHTEVQKKMLKDSPNQKQEESVPVLERLYEDARRKNEARRLEIEEARLVREVTNKEKKISGTLFQPDLSPTANYHKRRTKNSLHTEGNGEHFFEKLTLSRRSLVDSCATLDSIPEDDSLDTTDSCDGYSFIPPLLDLYGGQGFSGEDSYLSISCNKRREFFADMSRKHKGTQAHYPGVLCQCNEKGSIFDRLHSDREEMEKKRIKERLSAQKDQEKELTFRPKTNARARPMGGRQRSADAYVITTKAVDERDETIPEHYIEDDISSQPDNKSDRHALGLNGDEPIGVQRDHSEFFYEDKMSPTSSVLRESFKKLEEAHRALL